LGFKVEAAQNLLTQDPGAVGDLLSQLKLQIKSALGDVRRIAYNLRPPALDQLGLVPAIQEHVNSLKSPAGLTITLDAPPELPDLPAAIEVAAYRIVLEAITNVSQHAHASWAAVQLKVNHWLEIEITDDGRGLPAINSPGVGISSMRERAAELGGTCTFTPRPDGGTRVSVMIPLHLTEQSGGEGG
jgi:signal transduction histidine kinase